ncbi:MAG: mechanosensitive ion channel [Rhodospirillales bacterium]|nr:MAG: mechanosensitive ion channel [Rhodospirillales bacterium]
MRHLLWAVLAMFTLAGMPTVAPAAEATAEAVTVADLEDLVATIEDDAQRQQLVNRLKTLIEVKKSEASATRAAEPSLAQLLIEQLSTLSEGLGKELSAVSSALLGLPTIYRELKAGLMDPNIREEWLIGLLSFIAVVGAGLVARRIARLILKRPLAAVSQVRDEGVLVKIPFLLARLALILIPSLAFAAAGWAAVGLFEARSIARPVALAIIYAVALAGAVNAVARVVLAPRAPEARPFRMGNETAAYLYIWVRRLGGVGIYGYFGVTITGLLGLSRRAQEVLVSLVGLALALLLIMLILQNRQSVARLIGGTDDGRLRRARQRLADLWHVLAVLYVVVVFLVWLVGAPGGFVYVVRATALSALSIAATVIMLKFVLGMVDRAFALSHDIEDRLPGLEARVNRYLPAIKAVLRGLALLIAVLAVLQAWGVDVLIWLGEPGGRELMGRFASVGAIILLALIGWEAVSTSIERYLATDTAAQSQRARTLLPLMRKVTLFALTVVVGLTVLSELGINIAPLLAGAGVIGLAVGFGAQTLVRDIITGLFILIEDTVSVGDFVTLGGHGGTVEALSIRSIRLRDPSGIVHTIPFSDVTTVVNHTREFAYAMLDIGVAYKEDVDAVSRVIEEVGAELRQDPEMADDILEDLQLLGLDRFDDSAVVIRARIKTAPGKQWAMRRAFNRLLKQRFDAEGIEIPFPQRTVWFAREPAQDELPERGAAPGAGIGDAAKGDASGS